MCGIAGIVGEVLSRSTIERMVDVQNHRGPDARGVMLGSGAGFGHNRLAILDLTDAASQPMVDPSGRFMLVYNGEIYNFKQLKKELIDFPFRGDGDSEVLLAAYLKWGERCVEHLLGMFAFAVWDNEERVLFCARDRLGKKPFHYAISRGRFIFGSEIKAIMAAGVEPKPNLEIWRQYWNFGVSDHTDQTFFSDVYQLDPGHTLLLKDSKISIKEYWNLPNQVLNEHGESTNLDFEYLNWLVADSVKLRMQSDVAIGVNLSGGLDSGSLFRLVTEVNEPQQHLESYTGCFEEEEYNEGPFASLVNSDSRWSRNFEVFRPSQAWDFFQELVAVQEAPFGGVASTLRYLLAQKASQDGIKVILQAEGVDELFAGYAYYEPYYWLDTLDHYGRRALEKSLQGKDKRRVFEQMRAAKTSPLGLYQDGTKYQQPQGVLCEDATKNPPEFAKPFAGHLQNRLFQDLRYLKLPRVLRINDRLSMACSIEFREPFLDHRIVEYAFALGNSAKIHGGVTKAALRSIMQDRLPNPVRLEPKRPVVTPQREWLRGQLRPLVEELINDGRFKNRGIFDPSRVSEEYKRFVSGRGQNSFFVWQWINTELWFRAFSDR